MLLSLILESNLIVDHETKSCMLRESPFKCFECLYFLKIWWAKKTAALKICDSGVYIFIFVDFSEKSSVSWKPKDLKIISKFTALFHREQLYRAKDQFPKKLVCVLLLCSSATRWMFLCFSEYYFVCPCTLWHPSIVTPISAPWSDPPIMCTRDMWRSQEK